MYPEAGYSFDGTTTTLPDTLGKLAKMLDVPFAVADATTLTEAGYVGDDVENILLRLYQNSDYDASKAERGIIYIDLAIFSNVALFVELNQKVAVQFAVVLFGYLIRVGVSIAVHSKHVLFTCKVRCLFALNKELLFSVL